VKALSGKEFTRMLKSHGWSLQRINGSHHIYAKAAMHGSESLKVARQRHFMKLAGPLP
jgi:predicted RNA binding protein YcfA (HicA-like mRNA interferase family)